MQKSISPRLNFGILREAVVVVCICLMGFTANAVTINVSSIAALQTAINSASAGDIIVLANGTYLNNTINVTKSNITIRPANLGGVYLNGTNDININANFVTFTGFQFTAGDIGTAYLIEVYGSSNVLSQLNFSGYFAKKYIEVKAGTQYNEISYCNIEQKPATAEIGCTIQISTSPTVIGYHKIRYCSFRNYYGVGGDNGNEPVRIGLGSEALNVSRTVVEYCYFNNTGLGDGETVSVKCRENTIRYCTFTNQQNAMLSFRNGDNNIAYSNFFINAGGIRVKEANNIFCYNNYFENSGVGSSADAVDLIYYTVNTTNVLNNINFIHNTFYNCGFIDLGGIGATNNTWANNIFQKASGNIFKNSNTGTSWAGNMFQGSLGISIPSGITNINPLLTLNSDGYQGLSASSPAINAASASYPSILDIAVVDDDPTLAYDISGQARPSTINLKDVGCDEYSTGATIIHPLALTEVGPSYLGGPVVPIRLLNFDVYNQNNKASLVWATSSEQNSSLFDIQKSIDGFNFFSIAKINAAGNSASTVKYQYIDLNTAKGVYYYRLKQIDLDGKFDYSVVKKINFSTINSFNIYPNPAKNTLNIYTAEIITEKQNVTLYNLQGQLIKTFSINENSLPSNLLSLNIGDVENGIYLVRIVSGNVKNELKLVVQK